MGLFEIFILVSMMIFVAAFTFNVYDQPISPDFIFLLLICSFPFYSMVLFSKNPIMFAILMVLSFSLGFIYGYAFLRYPNKHPVFKTMFPCVLIYHGFCKCYEGVKIIKSQLRNI